MKPFNVASTVPQSTDLPSFDNEQKPSALLSLWRRLTARKPSHVTAGLRCGKDAKPGIEALESRIAPAAVINSSTLEFKDSAGDLVVVKFSKPVFTSTNPTTNLATANSIFHFDTGSVDNQPVNLAGAPLQQLQLIDLTHASGLPSGLGISVTTVAKGKTVDVGYINATGIALGAVKVGGDLGRIDAGNSSIAAGLASLNVQSLGEQSTATQETSGASLQSHIVGTLGSLVVAKDVSGASIFTTNGNTFYGGIGSITIGGSLIGSSATDGSGDQTGLIDSTGNIGAVKIGTSATAGIIGGGGVDSGSIHAAGKIASAVISGKVAGGAGQESGSIRADLGIGNISIGGNLSAGTGDGSGVVSSLHDLGLVKIGGNIDATISGAGSGSGGISAEGAIKGVTVSGLLEGGSASQSGFIQAGTSIGAMSFHGIVGGSAQSAGTVSAGGQIASLTVQGNIVGGSATGAGSVLAGEDSQYAGGIGSIKISGALQGGTGDSSGMISAGGKIGAITVGPSKLIDLSLLSGGAGDFSGSIFSAGSIGSVKVTGNLQGGVGSFSGAIVSHDLLTSAIEQAGDVGAISVGKITGGAGDHSGGIFADGNLKSLTSGNLAGGVGNDSGSVEVGLGISHPGTTGAISVKGTLSNGVGAETGAIIASSRMASVTIAGAVNGGEIRAGDDIGALTFGTSVSGLEVSARGQAVPTAKSDVAIGKITVNGDVSQSQFLAGYDLSLDPVNPDAQVGAVLVTGNWTASDLVAGVIQGSGSGFGTAADTSIPGTQPTGLLSKIASVVIKGTVAGTASAGDHFGFTAEKIGSFSAHGVKVPITGLGQSFELDPVNGDVTVREVPVPI